MPPLLRKPRSTRWPKKTSKRRLRGQGTGAKGAPVPLLAVADFAPPLRGISLSSMRRLETLAALAAIALAGCSEGPPAAPPEVTADEAQALEDAASMLDEARLETGPDTVPQADTEAGEE